MRIYNPVAFDNYPFVSDEEIERLVSAHQTYLELEHLANLNLRKLDHYQRNRFFIDEKKHLAHLSVFERIIKKCQEELKPFEDALKGVSEEIRRGIEEI